MIPVRELLRMQGTPSVAFRAGRDVLLAWHSQMACRYWIASMPSIREQLETQLRRFEELERKMSDPAVLADGSKLAAVAREHGSLAKVATKYRRFKALVDEVAELKRMSETGSPDEKELAEAELPEARGKARGAVERAARHDRRRRGRQPHAVRDGNPRRHRRRRSGPLRPGPVPDVQAPRREQGLEDARSWKPARPTWAASARSRSAFEGEGVYRELRYEGGTHRVQRVPETEAKGRVHTSAATVAVLPEPEDVEINLKPDDYRLDKFCASGPGGQHVNKTESAVRLTHYETNIVVSMQDEKSQHKNLAKALRILKSRLYEHYQQAEAAKRAAERKTMVGSGDRSDKIRTYNFPDNRLTDHRIGFTIYKLDQIIRGDFQPVTDALIEHDRNQLRDEMGGLDV